MIDERDGTVYKTVIIGNQVWMSENLRYLPEVNSSGYYLYGYDGTDQEAAKTTDNYQTYGVLYNWHTAMDYSESSNSKPSWVQGICPEGWHLPSDAEWNQLQSYLGEDAGGKLKHTDYWKNPNWEATNETGFSALPGGNRNSSGDFKDITESGYWWSSTQYNNDKAKNKQLYYGASNIMAENYDKHNGLSVRCVRDKPVYSHTLTLQSSDEMMGTVSGGGVFLEREKISIEAIANPGYKFTHWSGDTQYLNDLFAAIAKLTMPDINISLTAHFIPMYTLTLEALDNDMGIIEGDGDYMKGEVVKIRAIANFGCYFKEWIGDIQYLNNYNAATAQFIMPEKEITLYAIFEKAEYYDNIGSFTDTRDNTKYNTIKIGDQVWMAENLRYLPSVVGSATGSRTEPYFYVYDYDGTDVEAARTSENYQTYGVLYNWPAAAMNEASSSSKNPSGVQGVCPDGWHLPSDAEWTELENYLADNGYNYDGSTGGGRDKIAKAMAAVYGWNSYTGKGAIGNTDYPEQRNKSGFSALPGGYRNTTGNFYSIGFYGYWWSATEYYTTSAWTRSLAYTNGTVYRYDYNTEHGFSVRCVRDYPESSFFTLIVESEDETKGTVSGGGKVLKGVLTEIKAIAKFGYKFKKWEGDTNHLDNPNVAVTTLTMPGKNILLTAVFEEDDNVGSFTDTRDNTEYNTVQIGDQVWMAENLRYLPSVVGSATGSRTEPYFYVYDYDGTDVEAARTSENYQTYGVLYNWPAAAMNEASSSSKNPSGVQGVCPDGWHLPSDAEWTELENYLADNGYNYDGSTGGGRDKIAKAMAAVYGWNSYPGQGAIGNTDYPEQRNRSGFSALPGGYRGPYGGFDSIGNFGYWWSATEYNTNLAWYRYLFCDNSYVSRYNYLKATGFSVRCVRD